MASHREDWTGHFRGPVLPGRTPGFVLRPGSVEEVVEAVKLCAAANVPIVPQGGNTGLVGGGVPTRGDEVVLSLGRMDAILDFDDVAGIVSCEAGCVLDALSARVAPGHVMPLDLGSSGTCQIGGNLSTNAGGLRVVRYGSLRASVLGLEVVQANGERLDLMNTMRKDNVGYDLKQLFIGSEGTLGIITKAAILTPSAPSAVNVALLGLSSYADVVSALAEAKRALGEVLSAVEYWDAASMRLVLEHCPEAVPASPLGASEFPFHLLVETSGSNNEHDMEKLSGFLEGFPAGVLAASATQAAALWAVRENIPVALKRKPGHTYKYDVSVPTLRIDEATETVRRRLRDETAVEVFQYGHVGDGNLHLNVCSEQHDAGIKDAIESSLYDFIRDCRGSISAEHGIGVLKAHKMDSVKGAATMGVMRGVKALMDPHNLLNPGKVLHTHNN